MDIIGYIDSKLLEVYDPNSHQYRKSRVLILDTLLKSVATLFFLGSTSVIFNTTNNVILQLNLIYISALIVYGITIVTTLKGYFNVSSIVSTIIVHILIFSLILVMNNSFYAFYWSIFLLAPFLSTWFYFGNRASIFNLIAVCIIVFIFPIISETVTYKLTFLFVIFYITIGGLIIFTRVYYNRTQRELEKIRVKNQELQKVEALGRLTGGIAHDFNNKLATILGYSELINHVETKEEIEEYVSYIIDTVDTASLLVDQLLAYSKNKVVQKELIDLDRLLLKLQPIIKTALIKDIVFQLDLNTEGNKINANEDQLIQIILNFTFNSVDAMPNGGVFSISTEIDHQTPSKIDKFNSSVHERYIHMKISDTGIGIPEQIKPKIFDPFFTTKKNSKGGGLGLSTAYGIIKQSFGEIITETEVDKGTTFHIYLPISVEKDDATVGQQSRSIYDSSINSILIVDDDPMIRDIMTQMLKDLDIQVTEAADGEQAWATLSRYDPIRYRLVISDIKMPNLNGIKLTQRILENYDNSIKILLISGYIDNNMVSDLLEHSNVSFLEKPFTQDQLFEELGILSNQ